MYNREYTPELPDADSGSVLVKKNIVSEVVS